jgi:hypothetical protein
VSSLTWGRKQIQFPKRCVFYLFRKNPDDGQSPKTQYLWINILSRVLLTCRRGLDWRIDFFGYSWVVTTLSSYTLTITVTTTHEMTSSLSVTTLVIQLPSEFSSTDCFTPSFDCRTASSKVKVTLRLTVCHSVSLGVEPHVGLMTRYLLLLDSYGLVFVGRPLWREDGSIFCICWSSPAQSFSGPSPLGLATILYPVDGGTG